MSTVSTSDLYYDSADFEIARNPYPVFKRLRDEAPLYYNDDRDFYAVSRFDDVASVSSDNKTFINKYGGTLDLIKSGIEIPPGTVLFEDEPAHGIHRSLLASRVLHPEERGRARRADPTVLHRRPRRAGSRRLRFRARHRRDRPDAGDRHAPRHSARAARRRPRNDERERRSRRQRRAPLRHGAPRRLREVAPGASLRRRRDQLAEAQSSTTSTACDGP